MQTVTVIESNRYRDGGTIQYKDQLNRLYYTFNSDTVFNEPPFPRGNLGDAGSPTNKAPYVDVIPVKLNIVKYFNQQEPTEKEVEDNFKEFPDHGDAGEFSSKVDTLVDKIN